MPRLLLPCLTVLLTAAIAACASAQPVEVELVQREGDWTLLRGGEPYTIQGAGGDGSLADLADAGANSIRTWGVDEDTKDLLDEAHRLGLTVTVGIWLGHERHGFDYSDPEAVRAQFEKARKWVRAYKDHPALLMWAVGNEMEGDGKNVEIYLAVEQIAEMIQREDPNHPTMTVLAEIGGPKVKAVHGLCPSIDVVGINSYGGARSIPQRYREAGGTKPYVLTEYGPLGPWEVGRTDWGAAEEMTSTEKVEWYAEAYDTVAADAELGLGSYAFTWGHKQEATATWFGLLLPDGARLGPVDALTERWSGRPPENFAPVIEALELVGEPVVEPEATVTVELDVSDPDGDALRTDWRLTRETFNYNTGGDPQAVPPVMAGAVVESDEDGAKVRMPAEPGGYRLFVEIRDGKGKAAVANVPLKVEAEPGEATAADPADGAELPYTVFGDDQPEPAFHPSGWMGEAEHVSMDQKHADNPHTGKTCLRFTYDKPDGWAGVVWQNPADDWGDVDGGMNFTGAQKMTFWARGKDGGEELKVGLGLIGRDKRFYDTAKAERTLTLTTEWKQYEIDLDGKDLTRIKTPFYWVVAGQGEPVTFYLDDIHYE